MIKGKYLITAGNAAAGLALTAGSGGEGGGSGQEKKKTGAQKTGGGGGGPAFQHVKI